MGNDGGGGGMGAPSAKKGRMSEYAGGGSQGGYQPGFGGYGGYGGGAPPPVPGANNFQAAADGGALRDRSNDVCYKVCACLGLWSRCRFGWHVACMWKAPDQLGWLLDP